MAEAVLAHGDSHGHGHDHNDDIDLHHQFEDIDQQNECYIVGMWSFLVTEIMFFGALFLTFTLSRYMYQLDFYKAHEHLNVKMGAFNTTVLLLSSWTMVMAVHSTQLRKKWHSVGYLLATIGFACTFLVVKYFEYSEKFADHLYPGVNFTSDTKVFHEAANMNHAQLFYGLYFGMTGLHAVHIIVGIGILLALVRLFLIEAKCVMKDYVPTELVGLYWHFVDLVWIFLFPLFYLMPKPH